MLPCTETSDVPGLNRGLQLAVPSHRRELQTAVSTSAGLTSALANTAVSRIVLASGTYNLIAELNITRSVILEAAVAGSVILNAQASSTSGRRVVNINPGSSGVVQLIGLGITGGYSDPVRVLMFRSYHRPHGKLTIWSLFAGRRCLCLFRHGHDNVFLDLREHSVRSACSCSKFPIAPMGELLTRLPRLTLAQLRTLRSTTVCTCRIP
jgi:hypothetical protein